MAVLRAGCVAYLLASEDGTLFLLAEKQHCAAASERDDTSRVLYDVVERAYLSAIITRRGNDINDRIPEEFG
ncbi:hypothetical protein [Actinopolyspora lacussalsi]|uniref:hypothetical protein n=1 Tax=Actinopolyspora righensis TaxID=995060 RepID=UPI001113DF33|nr:hypothetical protein [Actinopolyspora righensis]